ncbi:DeoR family transcriptional regulator [Larkinella arboricola]|uniref:DeoR family transcriptional regulator n=1 Tax=Larkinella arboricola TaxID=643671 RepID=A0A327X0K2_LARAB|nr:DeoR/GlpR family DNA-binding transcription regulator [Larkinella arboricola]RAJ99885.1 DeoR family transcriptional regulator [Larkinella arboricola]
MSFPNRKRIILQTVEEKGSVEVKELADLLQTSEITVRRDLTQMATDGLIYRTHGGAMKVSLAKNPVQFVNKTAVNSENKDYICRLAAQQIQEGDVIFMDCGSTVFRLCQFIRNKRIQVITNSLPVVNELLQSEVTVNLVGGEVDAKRQAVHGLIAHEHIARYRAHKAFLGVDGISAANGLSAHSETEAGMTLAMAGQAEETYLLCDSTKLEKDKYMQFAPLSLVQTLVTDPDARPEILALYREQGVRVMN